MSRVLLHRLADRELRNLDPMIREAVTKKLRELDSHPDRGRPLTHSRYRSLRIGDYRAIYELAPDGAIVVLWIGHPKHVYADFSKQF